jgi:hypothetical protein
MADSVDISSVVAVALPEDLAEDLPEDFAAALAADFGASELAFWRFGLAAVCDASSSPESIGKD